MQCKVRHKKDGNANKGNALRGNSIGERETPKGSWIYGESNKSSRKGKSGLKIFIGKDSVETETNADR